MTPEISVIVTTYRNTREQLQASLASILHQERVIQEVILVMVSNDPLIEIGKAWAKTINSQAKMTSVKFVKVRQDEHPGRSPQGSFFQINEGLKHATKPWIRWFSGDDELFPRANIMAIEALERSGKLVVYSDYLIHWEDREDLQDEVAKFFPYSREIHQRTNFIGDVSVWSRDLIDYTPFRWETWGNYSFWDFWLRIYEDKGDVFHHLPEVSWKYIKRNDSTHVMRHRNVTERQEYGEQRKKLLKAHPIK